MAKKPSTLRRRVIAVVIASLGLGAVGTSPASAAVQVNATTTLSASSATLVSANYTAATRATVTVNLSVASGTAVPNTAKALVTLAAADTGAGDAADLLEGATPATWTDATATKLGYVGFCEQVSTNTASGTNSTLDISTGTPTSLVSTCTSSGQLGSVATVNATSSSYASGVANFALYVKTGIPAGTYKFKLTTTDVGTGATLVMSPPVTFTLTVSDVNAAARTTTASASSAQISQGQATTFTVTDTFLAAGDATSSLSIAAPSSGKILVGASVASVTGGSAIVSDGAGDYAKSVTYTKDSAYGTIKATITVTLTAKADALGDYAISYGGTTTFTLTVRPLGYVVPEVTTAAAANVGLYSPVDKILYGPATVGSKAGTITVTQKTAAGTTVEAVYAKSVVAELTGVGSLNATSNSATTSVRYVAQQAGVSATKAFDLYADGRAGTASVVISVDGTAVATLKVTFYGAAKTVSVLPIYTVGKSTGGTVGAIDSDTCAVATTLGALTGTKYNDPAFAVYVKDANGVAIPAKAIGSLTVASSDTSVVPMLTYGFMDAGCDEDYTAGTFAHHYLLDTAPGVASGKSAKLTWTYTAVDGSTVSSDAVAVTTGGTASKVTLTLDKATYAAGSPAKITVTAKDEAGNSAFDNQSVILSLASNFALSSTLSQSWIVASGSKSRDIFAPSTSGTWTISGKDLNGNVVSVSASVTDPVTTAVEAAKAEAAKATAAVAAVQASVTAMQTAIASLVASTTATLAALSAQINKIMKKLKIK